MDWLMRTSLHAGVRAGVRATRVLVKAPLAVAKHLYRFTGRLAGALTVMRSDQLPCLGCGNAVSLVGRFQCGRCNYVFDGYAFTACPVCRSIPPYIPCTRCGVSLRNPMR